MARKPRTGWRATAAVAESTRQALQVADLWLDTATEFMPAPGQREAWSRSSWVERTLPVWKDVCAPVAEAVTTALARTLEKQIQEMPAEMGQAAQQMGALGSIMRTMAGTAFGLQIGQAIGELAKEALGATDTGLPLTREPGTALVPANVTAFAEGLEVDEDEARMFLAVREAATARLYAHVPWLRGQVLQAVAAYAREIRIDNIKRAFRLGQAKDEKRRCKACLTQFQRLGDRRNRQILRPCRDRFARYGNRTMSIGICLHHSTELCLVSDIFSNLSVIVGDRTKIDFDPRRAAWHRALPSASASNENLLCNAIILADARSLCNVFFF